MDEMMIRLKTKFMRKLVSKLLSREIKSKTGFEVELQLNEFDAVFEDGDITINANLEVKMNKQEFMRILKAKGLD